LCKRRNGKVRQHPTTFRGLLANSYMARTRAKPLTVNRRNLARPLHPLVRSQERHGSSLICQTRRQRPGTTTKGPEKRSGAASTVRKHIPVLVELELQPST
jgi:hypothetical protein